MNLVRRLFAGVGAAVLTLASFLVLPLIQAIAEDRAPDLEVRSAPPTELPPPAPPPEEEPPPEPEPEPEPPDLAPETPPLDLAQLELALAGVGVGDGFLAGDFAVSLGAAAAGASDVDALFSVAELDQAPRPIYQAQPAMTPDLRRKAPATVQLVFVVGTDGRVEDAIAQSSTDPAFERAALTAIRQWRFEPGRRKGVPVRSRVRQAMTFPKGG